MRIEREELEHEGDVAVGRPAGCCTGLPSIRMSPLSISSRPAMARSVVVLPQPDGPSSTTNSLCADLEVELADDVVVAEILLDVAKIDLGHGRLRPARLLGLRR